jgi:uncharacterized protein DUF2752
LGIISFLEDHLLTCQWKKAGIECMGCGMQRSVIHLFKGEFIEAFKLYPAIYTLLIMLVYLGLHLKFNFPNGHKILMVLFILNLSIIITNYILNFV